MRAPAVAGSFYPADPGELRASIDKLLDSVRADPCDARAYVVPHAGYRWSGPTAAHVYRRLADRATDHAVDRVVLLGPAHRVPLYGAAVPAEARWSTPLGPVDIDVDGARSLVAAGLAVADDAPHAPEYALEVQLPFLQALGFSTVLPVCIGQSEVDDVAALLAEVAAPGTLVLCSTDLSHYLSDEQARARDARTVAAIRELAPERIGTADACGRHALRGLLAWARSLQLNVSMLHTATSADEGGPRDRVVGYAAVALTE